ncbi:MAG: hypothetical protein AB8E15_00965 [Bdellovibrionales bacterium]
MWKEKLKNQFGESNILKFKALSPAVERYWNILGKSPKNPMEEIKIEKSYHWLSLSLASFLGQELNQPTEAWSKFAIRCVSSIWEKLKPDESDIAIFALGKLGSLELNLSSDIDMFYVGEDNHENKKAIIEMQKLLTELDEFGWLFRVDTDIRPGGKFSSLIQSIQMVENHYYNHGETWERLALLRLLPIVQSRYTNDIMSMRNKYCFRKYTDYSVFDDFRVLRGKIRKQSRQFSSDTKLNLKLMPGGIRDIELLTHSLTVLHGGKLEQLHRVSTSEQLDQLSQRSILDSVTAHQLENKYWELRRIENLVQAENDLQIHSINTKEGSLFDLEEIIPKKLEQESASIASIIDDIIEPHKISHDIPIMEEEQINYLHNLGFSKQSIVSEWSKLIGSTFKVKSSALLEEERLECIDKLLQFISKHSSNKDLALSYVADFFHNIRAKTSFLRILLKHPSLLEDLAKVFGSSPKLSQRIIHRPELLDNLILRSQILPPDDEEEFYDYLADHKYISELIYSMEFLRSQDIDKYRKQLSSSADNICKLLIERLSNNEIEIEILRLGKWGGEELGYSSDLDFIFLVENEKQIPLAGPVVRKFLNILQSPFRAGNIYDIDLRLRPSGKAGPIVVAEPKLIEYLSNEAQAWELQAYQKASYLSEKSTLRIRTAIRERQLSSSDKKDLNDIKLKLLKRSSNRYIDLKYEHGGIVDIEFSAQIRLLQSTVVSNKNLSSNIDFLKILSSENSVWLELLSIYKNLLEIHQNIALTSSKQSHHYYPDQEQSLVVVDDSFTYSSIKKLLLRSQELILITNQP